MNIIDQVDLIPILTELKDGSERAFNKLYTLYAKALYKKIRNIVKDDAIAEELLQDLFFKIWQKRETINTEQSFNSFLFTVANNLVYDYLRKVANNKKLTETLFSNAIDHYFHIEEAFSAKETANIFQQAIDKLSPQCKQVYVLCKIEGKSYDEASSCLGISKATVNSHMVKSNRFIKEYLNKNLTLFVPVLSIMLTI